jgi:hypothetical protein
VYEFIADVETIFSVFENEELTVPIHSFHGQAMSQWLALSVKI